MTEDSPRIKAYIQNLEDWRETKSIVDAESDRAAAVLAAAYLDDFVGRLVSAHMIDGAVTKSLLSMNGPLGTFASRCDLAYALGLMCERVHRNIGLIRKVRNAFAHDHRLSAFHQAPVRDYCLSLHAPQIWLEKWARLGTTPGPRHRFMLVAEFTMQEINQVAQSALRPIPRQCAGSFWQP